MAALDFPNAPAVGDKYPQPPVVGQPVYTWDGTKWTTLGGAVGSTGASDDLPLMAGTAVSGVSTKWSRGDHVHPSDTGLKGYVDAQDALSLKKAGDTMTGPLTLSQSGHWRFFSPGAGSYYDTIGAGDRFFVGTDSALDGFRIYSAGAGVNVLTVDGSTGQVSVPFPPVVGANIANKTYVDQSSAAAAGSAAAFSGIQINGSMEVSQENGSTTVVITNASKYVVDGWGVAMMGATGTILATQSVISSLPGFINCATLACTVANPLSGASDAISFYHVVEGYRWGRLYYGTAYAQPVTIGFWVFPNISGTMAVTIGNGAGNRGYVTDVPVLASSGWQYKTVTIPGDVAGAWNAINGIGAVVNFSFGCGSGRKGTANTWTASTLNGTAATTNFFAATGTIYITGVVIVPGTQAPSLNASPFVMRPYDQELVAAKRYYRRIGGKSAQDVTNASYGTASGGAATTMSLTPEMRVAPSMAKFGTFSTINCAVSLFSSPTTLVWQISPLAVGQMWDYGNTGGFIVDARM